MMKTLIGALIVIIFSYSSYSYSTENSANSAPQESQIKINIEQAAKLSPDNDNQALSKIMIALAFLGIISLGSFILVKKSKQKSTRKHAPIKMKLVNHLPLGPKKQLTIVEVGGEHVLIGVTDHHISLIKSLSILDEDIDLSQSERETKTKTFKNQLDDELKTTDQNQSKKFDDFVEDEFSISEVKTILSKKLSQMRRL